MRKTIICVDDEKIVLTSLISQLRRTVGREYQCEGFMSAEEAWQFIDELYAEGRTLELIICDWLMPRVRGDEFLIRVHKRFPDVPMIMLSGQADPEAVARVHKETTSLFKFVPKPWMKEELMDLCSVLMKKTIPAVT